MRSISSASCAVSPGPQIIVNESSLERIEDFQYYEHSRTHVSLETELIGLRSIAPPSSLGSSVQFHFMPDKVHFIAGTHIARSFWRIQGQRVRFAHPCPWKPQTEIAGPEGRQKTRRANLSPLRGSLAFYDGSRGSGFASLTLAPGYLRSRLRRSSALGSEPSELDPRESVAPAGLARLL